MEFPNTDAIMLFKHLNSLIYENGKHFLMTNQKFDEILNSLLITSY